VTEKCHAQLVVGRPLAGLQILNLANTRHFLYFQRNIKGRPFWSRVLSVRLNPSGKEHPL
jgi:hypothetical protein